MSNEEIVLKIQKGINESENLQLLYDRNLPLIRSHVKAYFALEDVEDIMQQAFLGLWEATKHFEPVHGCKFMSYAPYWIKRSVWNYIVNCGSVVRFPYEVRTDMLRYRKAVEKLSQELFAEPTTEEIAEELKISVEKVENLKAYCCEVSSLDVPIPGTDNLSVGDAIASEENLEENSVDELYKEHCRNELWKIVEENTTDREEEFIKGIYLFGKNFSQLAREYDLPMQSVRDSYYKIIRNLRRGKALRNLKEQFDMGEALFYRSGLNRYREHDFTSNVEEIAIRRRELREKLDSIIN